LAKLGSRFLASISSKRFLQWMRVWFTIPKPRCCDSYVVFYWMRCLSSGSKLLVVYYIHML
jgi:hypothetical protein